VARAFKALERSGKRDSSNAVQGLTGLICFADYHEKVVKAGQEAILFLKRKRATDPRPRVVFDVATTAKN
jgi:hypothetical protein